MRHVRGMCGLFAHACASGLCLACRCKLASASKNTCTCRVRRCLAMFLRRRRRRRGLENIIFEGGATDSSSLCTEVSAQTVLWSTRSAWDRREVAPWTAAHCAPESPLKQRCGQQRSGTVCLRYMYLKGHCHDKDDIAGGPGEPRVCISVPGETSAGQLAPALLPCMASSKPQVWPALSHVCRDGGLPLP